MMMKKIIISISLCLCFAFAAVAQDDNAAVVNKQGVYILPEQGDFALGIDALPILDFFGGNGKFDQSTIYGKYFLDGNRALRAKLTLSVSNTANKNAVPDNFAINADPLNVDLRVIDVRNISQYRVALDLGYEIRRGYGRVQGFFGGEVKLGFNTGEKITYDWANPMTELNQSPLTTTSWNSGNYSNIASRTTEVKSGKTFTGGLGGFIGAEYFIAPKLSMGCELSLAFMFSSTDQTETTVESWNTATNKLQTRTTRSYTASNYAQNVTVRTMPGTSVFFMFHF